LNSTETPIVKDLVLIGGGHSHISVLRGFGMKPIPGVRLTLICPDVYTPYSGMLPGFVAGHYTYDDIHIDLAVLARFAGARLFLDKAVGIDPDNKRILCTNRPPVPYDVASINSGSTPNTTDVPGAADVAVAVKPINQFAARWTRLAERLSARPNNLKLAVVGGGAGGVELALALGHRLNTLQSERPHSARASLHLVTRDRDILTSHNRGAARRLNAALADQGIQVHRNFGVTEVRDGSLRSDAGETIAVDDVFWATQASAPAWFRESGLAVDAQGFVQVDATLQSVSHPDIFAVGDAASVVDHPRPKSGVFAVRQGRPLTRNLRRVLLSRRPLPFSPQRNFLSLIATGPKAAVASRGPWSAQGAWAWTWKDWIDRRFMRRFADLPAMAQPVGTALPSGLADPRTQAALSDAAMRCGGCGAKIAAPVLDRVLTKLNGVRRPDVLVGLDQPDDAAVIAVPEGKVLVQTVDSFRAMVDDPFLFGKITANHCLNDIYAMGAEPQTALAIVTIPYGLDDKVEDTLTLLLAGASEVLNAANTQLVGGHSGEGAELALGFSVNGLADRNRLLHKGQLGPGERLVLTKAVGTGTLFAAEMRGKAKGRWIASASKSMLQSNRDAADCLARHGAKSCTDVTGFGIVGHALEMLPPDVGLDLDVAAVPLLEGARETVSAGITSSMHVANAAKRHRITNDMSAADDPRITLLFDPQTAGGLMAGIPADNLEPCLAELRALGYLKCAAIGTVRPGLNSEKPITLVI
jgi:selenide,water dikinase